MPPRTKQSGQSIAKTRQAGSSTFGNHAPAFLKPIKLHKSIKPVFRTEDCPERWAHIALMWLDSGESEPVNTDSLTTARDCLASVVTQWVQRQTEGIKHLGCFDVHLNPLPFGDLDHRGTNMAPESFWVFAIDEGEAPNVLMHMKDRFAALESFHPALAVTAYRLFVDYAYRTLPILSPNMARDLAEYTWWYGGSSQEEYEAERELVGEPYDPEEEDHGYTPEGFDQAFPEWMFRNPGSIQTLNDEQLLALKADHAESIGTLIDTLVALRAIDRDSYRLPWLRHEYGALDEENAYFLAYIGWEKRDMVFRLNDDYIEQVNYSGDSYTTMLGADLVHMDRVQFLQWKSEMEAGFAVLRKLDVILDHIAEPFNWDES